MEFSHKYYPQKNNDKDTEKDSCAVLLGWNNNSIDMLNSLRKKKISVIIVYSSEKFSKTLGLNNYQNEHVDFISTNLVKYLNEKIKIKKTQVLISSDDTYTVLLAFAKEKLIDNYIYQNLSMQQVQKCVNKVEFYLLCKELKIDSPKTYIINNRECLNNLKAKLTFPGIVKPHYPGAVSKILIPKVLKINNFEELERLGGEIWPTSVPVFFQEFIPGGSDCIFFVGGYFSENELDSTLFVGRKVLEIPVLGGSTTYATLQWNENVFEAAKHIVKSIGYRGLADIEFKFDSRDGKFKIIEVNPRIGRWHSISSNGDFDIISVYFLKMLGVPLANINLHIEGQSWISPHLSLCGFIEKKGIFIGGSSWIIAMKKAQIKVDVNTRDLRKTLHQLRVVLGHVKSIGFKKAIFGS